MILSQKIAMLLEEMLEENAGELSIVRNEFATRLGCVPSQINYVITSRFTPERGYVVESRRGGGGYIRIRKVVMEKSEYLSNLYRQIPPALDLENARYFLNEFVQKNILTQKEAKLLFAAIGEDALSDVAREGSKIVRSRIFKHIILQILSESEE